jgi:hypothetical protein
LRLDAPHSHREYDFDEFKDLYDQVGDDEDRLQGLGGHSCRKFAGEQYTKKKGCAVKDIEYQGRWAGIKLNLLLVELILTSTMILIRIMLLLQQGAVKEALLHMNLERVLWLFLMNGYLLMLFLIFEIDFNTTFSSVKCLDMLYYGQHLMSMLAQEFVLEHL